MDIQKLQSLIDYNPETGSMVWKPRNPEYFRTYRGYAIWTAKYCGKEVGCSYTMKSGYTCRVFSLQGHGSGSSRMFCHRAAWAIMTGRQPPKKIDHINQDATDNRWVNLRDGTNSINERNMFMRRDNTSGVPGVSWSKLHRKWETHVGHKGKKISLGLFEDISEAEKAVRKKRGELGYSPLHGRPRTD